MKRKLIAQGSGAFTISLPKNWIENNKLSKGQEIELNQIENKLILSTSNYEYFKSIKINTKNMDRNMFLKTVIANYENGVTEIILNFESEKIYDPWAKKHRTINEEVNFITNRLIGFEVIHQSKDKIIIRDISKTNISEFNNILSRITFLILEFNNLVKENIKNNTSIENGEEYHDNITKFISFCIRLLTLDKNRSDVEKTNLHTILYLFDNIVDDLRYLSRDYNKNHKIKDEKLIFELIEYLDLFFKFYNKYDYNISNKLDTLRNDLKNKVLICEDKLTIRFSAIMEEIQALLKPVICLHEFSINY
jgi:hypothetical protein